MSAVYVILLLLLIAVSTAVLVQLRALRTLATARLAAPAAVDEDAIRRAVTEALAADREREITEARAFWAEQEARAAEDDPLLDTPPWQTADGETLPGTGPVANWPVFFPRPTGPDDAVDNAGTMDPAFGEALRSALEDMLQDSGTLPGPSGPAGPTGGTAPGAELAASHEARAAREADLLATGLEAGLLDPEPVEQPAPAPDPRRHPSHPDFVPSQTPSREWTDTRLTALAEERIALTDVRPGPLGTLDVYAFADGTTLCVAPGDREAAYRLIDAVRAGEDVRLLGGSRFSGSYSLTFSTDEEAVYVLADRVVASV
ncbi:hypothetical protein [Kitasatospora sp. LaBMicrA B282]|uniref:hypothetical protein n=1 Tax=Kitasatospora sp. LaBMicrA B282 TaxID=3420949 RepID=UPI003D0E03ED